MKKVWEKFKKISRNFKFKIKLPFKIQGNIITYPKEAIKVFSNHYTGILQNTHAENVIGTSKRKAEDNEKHCTTYKKCV